MTRTTLDLDPHVLKELRRRHTREGRPMGQLASELLAQALAAESEPAETPNLDWPVRSMGALVDIGDKEALHRILDEDLSA